MNTTVASAIESAIDDLRRHFGNNSVTVLGHDTGGTWVRVDGVALGGVWIQATTFVIVHLASTLPFADIYPIFVRADLGRADGRPLQTPVTPGHQAGPIGAQVPAAQVSRRTRGDASRQTAGQKITKVIEWLRVQP
ncbi:MAG: hypothetical protein HY828_03410 [Actinobacteria bacterium]|nr:hypothetical protein [Actinomycetota bacterium]